MEKKLNEFKIQEAGIIKNIEEFKINADYQKIKQVLFNLLSNALKFTKNKIKIIVQKIDSKVVIKVIDNGIGIEKKNQKKIFNKFTQINDYSTKNESSTGLGLTISKGISFLSWMVTSGLVVVRLQRAPVELVTK